jgi:hypothetical protein
MLTEACRDFVANNGYIQEYKQVHIQASQAATEALAKRSALENAKRLVPNLVPVQSNPKDGPATYSHLQTYAIDWTIRMYEGASAASFNPSASAHAQSIARHTQAFEVWARANNR